MYNSQSGSVSHQGKLASCCCVYMTWASLEAQMVKNSPANAGDLGSILGSGRSPEEGNGYPLQYSCLENSMTEELSGLQSMGVTKISDMTE